MILGRQEQIAFGRPICMKGQIKIVILTIIRILVIRPRQTRTHKRYRALEQTLSQVTLRPRAKLLKLFPPLAGLTSKLISGASSVMLL